MMHRFLLLATLTTTAAFAAPMTIVFSGNATGTIGSKAFTNQGFTISFTTDSASVVQGGASNFPMDYTTPSGSAAAFNIANTTSGNLSDNQAVFVNQSEANIGVWHDNGSDYLDIGAPSVATYTLSSNAGPISGTANSFPQAQAMSTSQGALVLTSVSGVSATVTVSTSAPQTPVISTAGTAWSTGLAQNTYIAITGSNLVPSGTPAGGFFWSTAASFATGQMPTSLNGVSVKVNGKPAYIYFYCSGSVSGSICPQDQINALTPLDSTTGPVQITVSNGSATSVATSMSMTTVSPAMLEFSNNYVTATHANATGSLLGPATLYPGLSTPASIGETVVLWTVGYGLPNGTLTAGSDLQSGSLPTIPTCTIGGASAPVSFAGVVSPGLYQLNVQIPTGAAHGDNAISCSYGGATTQTGLKIAVQ